MSRNYFVISFLQVGIRLGVPLVFTAGLFSCGADDRFFGVRPMSNYEHGEIKLSESQQRERIRSIAKGLREKGVHNALLIAGIADAESGMAHCWSEATWACKGQASASCGGGAVIAGSADGPCAIQQGGLGMFQFVSGTHSQTLGVYGQSILTVEGNASAVLPFFVKKITTSPKTAARYGVSHIRSESDFVKWINTIKANGSDRLYQNWLGMVSCLYNGSCDGQKIQAYQAATSALLSQHGDEVFQTGAKGSVPAAVKPSAGVEPTNIEASCQEVRVTRTSGDRIRLRSSPMDGEVIGFVEDGQVLRVISASQGGMIDDPSYPEYSSNRWYEVSSSELQGWVSAVYAECL